MDDITEDRWSRIAVVAISAGIVAVSFGASLWQAVGIGIVAGLWTP